MQEMSWLICVVFFVNQISLIIESVALLCFWHWIEAWIC